jgi:hypothetical protein
MEADFDINRENNERKDQTTEIYEIEKNLKKKNKEKVKKYLVQQKSYSKDQNT